LAEYLAGCRYAREFATNSPLFSSRISQRPWAPDSMIFQVLARTIVDNPERLVRLGESATLPSDGLRNLVQILAFVPEGDRFLRAGRLLLEGARLGGVCLRKLNLDGVSFRGCDLTNVDFAGSSLRNTRFEGALLENTLFTDVPRGALEGAAFGNCEHFDSVIVGQKKRIEDVQEFNQWLKSETGSEEELAGPCPTSRQLLHLFRKFILVDGQGRRDQLDPRGIVRGRQEPGAPAYKDCVEAALDFGYLEQRDYGRIGRVTGAKYGELVTFVKSQRLSSGLSSLLDSLCRVPGCAHVPASG